MYHSKRDLIGAILSLLFWGFISGLLGYVITHFVIKYW